MTSPDRIILQPHAWCDDGVIHVLVQPKLFEATQKWLADMNGLQAKVDNLKRALDETLEWVNEPAQILILQKHNLLEEAP